MVARHDDRYHRVIVIDVQSDHASGGEIPGSSVHLQPVIANQPQLATTNKVCMSVVASEPQFVTPTGENGSCKGTFQVPLTRTWLMAIAAWSRMNIMGSSLTSGAGMRI